MDTVVCKTTQQQAYHGKRNHSRKCSFASWRQYLLIHQIACNQALLCFQHCCVFYRFLQQNDQQKNTPNRPASWTSAMTAASLRECTSHISHLCKAIFLASAATWIGFTDTQTVGTALIPGPPGNGQIAAQRLCVQVVWQHNFYICAFAVVVRRFMIARRLTQQRRWRSGTAAPRPAPSVAWC